MTDIRSKIFYIYSLEQLSQGNTSVHAIHPFVKMLSTLVYIICVVSFGRYELLRVVPYIFYPVIIIAMAEIPYKLLFKRVLIALPFCLFAGISNLFFDQSVIVYFFGTKLTGGFISFAAIIFRTFLSVSAVLILIAVTPFSAITSQLRRLHLPEIIVSLFEMTYRYVGTLISEAASMYTAYKLRSGNEKGLKMKDMGSFAGQLLIRSFDRAERVYSAMKCRGYPADNKAIHKQKISYRDIVFFALVCGSSVLFRLVDVMGIFSQWLMGI